MTVSLIISPDKTQKLLEINNKSIRDILDIDTCLGPFSSSDKSFSLIVYYNSCQKNKNLNDCENRNIIGENILNYINRKIGIFDKQYIYDDIGIIKYVYGKQSDIQIGDFELVFNNENLL